MRKTRNTLMLFFSLLILFLQACTSPVEPGSVESSSVEAESPSPDPASLVVPDLCQLVSGQDVVTIAGGSLLNDPFADDLGENFKACTYELTPSEGGYEYYIVYVQPSEWILTVFGDEYEGGEQISGLGDSAILKWEEREDQFRLLVIQEGDLGIELIGPRSQVLLELARLFIDRLEN